MASQPQVTPETKFMGLATVEVQPDRISITVPRRPSFRVFFGLAFVVLVSWFTPKYHHLIFDTDKWLEMWFTFLIGSAFLKGLWDVTSRDIISVDAQQLVLNRGVLGLGWNRRYPLREIGRLRWVHEVQAGKNTIPSCIAFDYQYMPVGCAFEIGEPEANKIIDLIKSRFPEMGTAAQVSVF
jgi:hypothetical protein